MVKPQPILETADHLGEGLFWDAASGSLFWLDVPMPSRIHRFQPETGTHESWPMPVMVTAMAMLADGSGLLVAAHNGINILDLASGTLRHVLSPEIDAPFNRCNDGATDCRGRFWFGTMHNNMAADASPLALVAGAGALYCLERDFTVTRKIAGMTIPNTICWSPDNTVFYCADTPTGWIHAFNFDPDTGEISGKREFAHFDRGVPDGSTVDAEGFLWNARWGGGCIVRFAPDGAVDRIVEFPVDLITNCTFGGPELDTLYVTTARYGLTPEEAERQPLAGRLFALQPGVRGLVTERFGQHAS